MQILTGAKRVRAHRYLHRCTKHILNKDVKRVDVPHYPSLSLEKILEQFKKPHKIYEYLPDEVNEFVVNR
jgi:hypothetical protein